MPRIILHESAKSYHAKHRVSEKDIFDNEHYFRNNHSLRSSLAGKSAHNYSIDSEPAAPLPCMRNSAGVFLSGKVAR